MDGRPSASRTPGTTFEFEGRTIPIEPGDTIGSALYRSGVRVLTRSFKYHRRRGLYCVTGDCPNCLVNIDCEPCVRACVTDAAPGQRVRREGGWPSVERDAFGVFDRMHKVLPVGFYYKTLLRPKWLWPHAEPWIRRLAGLGTIDQSHLPRHDEQRHLHPDVAVLGGGVAGLSAALAAAAAGETVVLCDEGRLGEKIAPGPDRDRVHELAAQVAASPAITLLEQTPAIGIYEGPLVVMNEPSFLHLVHPQRVAVATGAVEEHGVFRGNDLPGVFLGRGAARLAGVHGVPPGNRVVLVGRTREAAAHAETLRGAGAEVTQVDGEIVEARGRKSVSSVVVDRGGKREELPCDALVLSVGYRPRDSLLLQGGGLPVVGVGEVVSPGLDLAAAEEQGARAGRGEPVPAPPVALPAAPKAGIVCLCEDVGVDELAHAWDEGFRSTEIVKRYTTATMGACQGQLCHAHVRAYVASRPGASGPGAGPTTARPPVRGITLERAAAGVRDDVHYHTALHERHLQLGATMEPAGHWRRPKHYGDAQAEYWAVRRGVSVMDVGTLGKFLLSGPDATGFLEQLYPSNVRDLIPGRFRYALLLGDHGFVIDDGIVCALGDDRFYLTFTSAGAATVDATLKDWAETLGFRVNLVDLTGGWGAINLAGRRSRELLQRLSDDPLDNESFPYLHHREITVAGVECRAIRLGFVGELSYELHHRGDRSLELWDALLEAGTDMEIRPHGLDALRVLRLEKGHIIIGQDTDFDATPRKLNMDWAVKLEKPTFVGKRGIERANRYTPQRQLVAVQFADHAPPEGALLRAGGQDVGYLTSSAWSPMLECGVSLGWATRANGSLATEYESDGATGLLVDHAFYDPKGERLRA